MVTSACVDTTNDDQCRHDVCITDEAVQSAAKPAIGSRSDHVRAAALVLVFRHK